MLHSLLWLTIYLIVKSRILGSKEQVGEKEIGFSILSLIHFISVFCILQSKDIQFLTSNLFAENNFKKLLIIKKMFLLYDLWNLHADQIEENCSFFQQAQTCNMVFLRQYLMCVQLCFVLLTPLSKTSQ